MTDIFWIAYKNHMKFGIKISATIKVKEKSQQSKF